MMFFVKVLDRITIKSCLKSNFLFAKKVRIANTIEELAIITSYLTSLFYTIWISSFLFLLRIEKRYSIDIKLLSFSIFFCISFSLLYYLFKKGRFRTFFAEIEDFHFSLFMYIVVILLTLLFLGFAVIYEYTDGDFRIVMEYLKHKF